MELRGHIENGKVVLDEPVLLPNGTEVSVRPKRTRNGKPRSAKEIPTIATRFKALVGKAKSLPPDASVNLDHYLYGLPKRK